MIELVGNSEWGGKLAEISAELAIGEINLCNCFKVLLFFIFIVVTVTELLVSPSTHRCIVKNAFLAKWMDYKAIVIDTTTKWPHHTAHTLPLALTNSWFYGISPSFFPGINFDHHHKWWLGSRSKRSCSDFCASTPKISYELLHIRRIVFIVPRVLVFPTQHLIIGRKNWAFTLFSCPFLHWSAKWVSSSSFFSLRHRINPASHPDKTKCLSML